jgi:protocatechuate 3,4-dioxygenase beta subunit
VRDDAGVSEDQLSRRAFLGSSAAASMAFVLAACGGGGSSDTTTTTATGTGGSGSRLLPATAACDVGHDDTTKPETEGPFFEPGSPRRRDLVVDGVSGTLLTVTGVVADTSCRPIPGALLDFWQADAAGRYDNSGYRLRGHQFADPHGRFALRTVVPGLYPGRTRHIHVKVQRPHGKVLTTQLYFPGEPRNRTDAIFDQSLLMAVKRTGRGRRATFAFILG